MSEAQPNVYETCDPIYLQQLRARVSMDVVQLARIACLSVAQVKSLEVGGDDLFYSSAIKRQAYKRTLMILGAPPPVAFTAAEDDALISPVMVVPVSESLNHIADLTTQSTDDWKSPASAGRSMSRQKVVLVGLAVVVTLGGVLAVYPNDDDASVRLASAAVPTMANEPLRVPVAKPAVASPVALASEVVKNAAAVDAVAIRASSDCVFSSDPGPEVSPAVPKKEGRFVYVVSPVDTSLCVVDGNKQASTLQLKAGEGHSVYGTSPWQMSGTTLTQIQIYFQGRRVSLPEGAVQKIVLVEKMLTP